MGDDDDHGHAVGPLVGGGLELLPLAGEVFGDREAHPFQDLVRNFLEKRLADCPERGAHPLFLGSGLVDHLDMAAGIAGKQAPQGGDVDITHQHQGRRRRLTLPNRGGDGLRISLAQINERPHLVIGKVECGVDLAGASRRRLWDGWDGWDGWAGRGWPRHPRPASTGLDRGRLGPFRHEHHEALADRDPSGRHQKLGRYIASQVGLAEQQSGRLAGEGEEKVPGFARTWSQDWHPAFVAADRADGRAADGFVEVRLRPDRESGKAKS